ncbi:GNAT family N-acetyltransferase [Cucumibacter marinus]|uniref:GNAT family N-acetyltransferase n=1 Tax=Cucumibacter marinus TaxID=1121252 RepID=UPI0003FB6598|nr:GNAT family N-acetyltransferase [Cucumibacter marinus]
MDASSIIDSQTVPSAGSDASWVDTAEIAVADHIDAFEADWRQLEQAGIDSPGQSYDFIRAWVDAIGLPRNKQVYACVREGGRPVLVLALCRSSRFGVRKLEWIPGDHVGCNAPVAAKARLAALGDAGRRALWRRIIAALPAHDVISLKAIPADILGQADLFGGASRTGACDFLYRSEFESWEQCDSVQRNRKRRKRDRQQGTKLDSLGDVAFRVAGPEEYQAALDTMFAQKAERFKVLGIRDPFADPAIQKAYHDVLARSETLKPLLYVMLLNGEYVSVRYCIGYGDRLFALISSMSEDPAFQVGSPGKQSLLRIVQTIFDEGWRSYDLGVGASDEKRNWCNVQLGVCHHYLPRTPQGLAYMLARKSADGIKVAIKSNEKLFGFYKRLRSKGVTAAASEGDDD